MLVPQGGLRTLFIIATCRCQPARNDHPRFLLVCTTWPNRGAWSGMCSGFDFHATHSYGTRCMRRTSKWISCLQSARRSETRRPVRSAGGAGGVREHGAHVPLYDGSLDLNKGQPDGRLPRLWRLQDEVVQRFAETRVAAEIRVLERQRTHTVSHGPLQARNMPWACRDVRLDSRAWFGRTPHPGSGRSARQGGATESGGIGGACCVLRAAGVVCRAFGHLCVVLVVIHQFLWRHGCPEEVRERAEHVLSRRRKGLWLGSLGGCHGSRTSKCFFHVCYLCAGLPTSGLPHVLFSDR